MKCVPVPVLILLCACGPPAPEQSVAASSVDGATMLSYVEFTADRAGTKLMDLARAMPEESYDWRPMDGVRSVGEVFLHVAADNWYGPVLLGVEAPPETGVTSESATVSAYQERRLSKQEIVTELEASFLHLAAAFEAAGGHLDQETVLGTATVSQGDVWVRLITHLHEHLGQSIAYARTNGVVPPWSR